MRISIITPTLNSEKYLESCIASIAMQTYKDIEHIVIDGKSIDNTVEILKKHPTIKWISEPDRGMYHAINKGIALASGDIIGVLNSDDIYADNTILEQIAQKFNETNCDCVYGNIVYVNPHNTSKAYRHWISGEYNIKKFKRGWMPPHPSFYHKKSLVEKMGEYENHFYTSADYELILRYLYKNKANAVYIPTYFVKMRTGGLSNNGILKRLRANRRDYLAMKKNGIAFPFLVSLLKPILKLPQYWRYRR